MYFLLIKRQIIAHVTIKETHGYNRMTCFKYKVLGIFVGVGVLLDNGEG